MRNNGANGEELAAVGNEYNGVGVQQGECED